MRAERCSGCHEMFRNCRCRREPRTILHAALYGLYLREHGYAAGEAALLVSLRYPCVQHRLQKLASRADRDQHEQAAAAAGGAGC